MVIRTLLSIILIFSHSAGAQFSSGELIDAEKINSHFEDIKTRTNDLGKNYDYEPFMKDSGIKAQQLNNNFQNFSNIVPSLFKVFQEGRSVKASDLNFNFLLIEEKIATVLSAKPCVLSNGVGEQRYDIAANGWDPTCYVKTCNENYYPSENNTSCILNNSIACTNQYDESFNLIGNGYINYDYQTKTSSCKIQSCVSPAYTLSNNSCNCSNESQCFTQIAQINSDLDEVNSLLTSMSQPSLSKVSTSTTPDYNLLNNNFNSLKSYAAANTLTSLSSSSITKQTWATQVAEAKRILQAYLSSCRDFVDFSGSPSDTNCSFAKKIKNNLNFINAFFPFYGDTTVAYSLGDNDIVNSSILNSLLNSFNNKTNKISAVGLSPSSELNSSILNSNFNNLLSNVRQRLETAFGGGYVANPYTKSWITSFNSINTSAGQTVTFKIADPSKTAVIVTSVANGTVCVNNEYCRTAFGGHNYSNVSLVDVQTQSPSGNNSYNLKLLVDTVNTYTQGSTQDFGCANADTFSQTRYNTWACDGGKNSCNRWCYAGSCTNNPATTFNNWFNSHGRYQYTSFVLTTGDLRGGCSGTYVYAYRTYFNYQQYNVGP